MLLARVNNNGSNVTNVRYHSTREKRLWLWALLIVLAIFTSLFIGQPLQEQLRSQNLQAGLFLLGMALVGGTILVHGIRFRPGRVELTVLIGVVAVGFMLFFRLGAPERSHMIEYSVLAVFVHGALVERLGPQAVKSAILAFFVTFIIGVIDETVQMVIPHRVFDFEDIVFNGIVIGVAIIASMVLHWIRRRLLPTTSG